MNLCTFELQPRFVAHTHMELSAAAAAVCMFICLFVCLLVSVSWLVGFVYFGFNDPMPEIMVGAVASWKCVPSTCVLHFSVLFCFGLFVTLHALQCVSIIIFCVLLLSFDSSISIKIMFSSSLFSVGHPVFFSHPDQCVLYACIYLNISVCYLFYCRCYCCLQCFFSL